jgi:hypothetical protein
MYATAHRVVRASTGETGINAFLHTHGEHFPWPQEAWRLPETNPGVQVRDNVELSPGGNRVRSYLDVLAPDNVSPDEIDVALTGLWLELVADEAAAPAATGPLPNPLVYQRGRVVLRFGVEGSLEASRSIEMAELRTYVDPGTARWRTTPAS